VQLSLTRVRLAFVALALLLLGALTFLVQTALGRLAHQRALRHEVVAERVFDELERELHAHLELESARPSRAYDAESSEVAAWAPFVVGYFTVDDAYRVVSDRQLEPQRTARIQKALAQVWPSPGLAAQRATASHESEPGETVPQQAARDGELQKAMPSAEVSLKKRKSQKLLETSSEVLRQLNRAQEVRKSKSSPSKVDPFAF
jgi:hypothetical protein